MKEGEGRGEGEGRRRGWVRRSVFECSISSQEPPRASLFIWLQNRGTKHNKGGEKRLNGERGGQVMATLKIKVFIIIALNTRVCYVLVGN